jgi:hypothetical protein
MKKLAVITSALVFATLAVTSVAQAAPKGTFAGTPTCTAGTSGGVTCTARVAGLGGEGALAFLFYQTIWACIADPTLTVVADNGVGGVGMTSVSNGRLFTLSGGARYPTFYEVIFNIDFGCPNEAWTAVQYTNVTIDVHPDSGADPFSYNVGTVYPS